MQNKDAKRKAHKALAAAQDALARLGGSVEDIGRAAELITKRKGDIIVTGIGKSGFVGQKIAATLTSLGHRAFFLHPTEAVHGDIGALSKNDVLLALSYSGESKEVVRIVQYAKKSFGVSVVAFTKSRRSALGRLAACCVELSIKAEGSPNELAPMASTTATLVLGDMLAAALVENNFKEGHFAKFHPGGALGLKFRLVSELMRKGSSVPAVRESDPLAKVLKKISDKKLGATAVIDSRGALAGVITDGDIRRFFLRAGNLEGARARDLMTKNPKHINGSDSLADALARMEEYKITHLFVVGAGKKPVGLVHIHDIVEGALVS